jgi:hypothetical protein
MWRRLECGLSIHVGNGFGVDTAKQKLVLAEGKFFAFSLRYLD